MTMTNQPKIILELNPQQAYAIEQALTLFVQCGLGNIADALRNQVEMEFIKPYSFTLSGHEFEFDVLDDFYPAIKLAQKKLGYYHTTLGITNPIVHDSVKSAYEISNVLTKVGRKLPDNISINNISPDLLIQKTSAPLAHILVNSLHKSE